MKIGIAEIVVICIIALVVLGPEKLPVYAKKLGSSLKEVKKVTGDLTKDIRENIVEPIDEASAPLKEVIEPIVSLKDDVNKSIDEVTSSIKSISKPVKKETKTVENDNVASTEEIKEASEPVTKEETKDEEVSLAKMYTGRKVPRRNHRTASTVNHRLR